MILKLQKSKLLKFISLFLAINFLLEIINPLRLYALTSGPSQPEMEGFTPADSSNMVDLFTGDFHYSIPLMTIPGPGGDYPLVLNYNASPTVEQEASWVGLGWSLNPGAISREMRGLPDDYNGQEVIQDVNKKDNINVAIGTNLADGELVGLPFSANLSGTLNYNTYAGIGITMNLGLSCQDKKNFAGGMMDLDLSWSNQGGFDVSPSLSYSHAVEGSKSALLSSSSINLGAGFNYNSRQGITTMNSNVSLQNSMLRTSMGVGTRFSSTSYVPEIENKMTGTSIRGTVKLGLSEAVLFNDIDIFFSYSQQKIADNHSQTRAYGTLYLENSDTTSLLDYNTEKEGVINKKSKNLPIPIMTHDLFSINGSDLSGSFRLYRNDMCGFMPKSINQDITNTNGGIDLGTSGASTHLGVNLSVNKIMSYSGGWIDGNENLINNKVLKFNGSDPINTNNYLYEPSYFKMNDDLSSVETSQLAHVKNFSAVRPEIEISGNDVEATGNIATSDVDNNTMLLNPNHDNRRKRSKSIQYRTVAEATIMDKTLYSQEAGLIHDFTVTNEDGTRYVYGQPLYNTIQKDVSYSTDNNSSYTQRRINCSSTEASPQNSAGYDHFYSSKELKPYAHTFLITAILSPDYVDLDTNKMPSDKDLGFWVKFSYDKKYSDGNCYKWRMPYTQANFSPGYLSNPNDNRASFTYGEKEIAYAKKIETKTHMAKFYMSPRSDGQGALGMLGSEQGTPQVLYRLDSIGLYAKTDSLTPIKTVHFCYNYALCSGTENSQNLGGKLTLTKLYITYGNNVKGKYSPYEFSYKNTYVIGNNTINMNYGIQNYDRWGYYNDSSSIYNPYVPQESFNKNLVDQWASAWCINSIKLPSGATINIEYESDDYAYVQNKPAEQMFRIVKLGDDYGGGERNECTKDNLRVYFRLNDPSDNDINKYIIGLKDNLIYFKTYMELVNNPNNDNRDYLEGYAEIDQSKCGITQDGLGYITFKSVDYGSERKTHPFRMAAWQYLRMYRTDLLFPSSNNNNAVLQIVYSIIDFVKELGTMLTGYYNFSYLAGRGKILTISNTYPSFIRLKNPSKCKKGGGHRVKKISINDLWNKPSNSNYAQNYIYKTYEDGRLISSGVAEYEPLVGGEENPFRTPVFYSTDRLLCRNDDLYMEEPFNESYFPSPVVGYSKVIVYNELPANVNKAATGITLNEFYTARDFPVITDYTEINHVKYSPFPITIPFIGSISNASYGYSQGYSIELNNMHGQVKAKSVYSHEVNPTAILLPSNNAQPVTKEEYFYKTKYPYAPNTINKLDNRVKVLSNDCDTLNMTLGETYDFFACYKENRTNMKEGSGNANIDIFGFIPISFMLVPGFELNDEYCRTVVTNKIIYKNGVLDEVVVSKDGARVSTKNVLYDAYTGIPILTETTTNHNTNVAKVYNAPIYTYNFMGKWYYTNMQPSYKNSRFTKIWEIPIQSNQNYFDLTNASKYFVAGDEVLVAGVMNNVNVQKKAWITYVDANKFEITDIQGTHFSTIKFIRVINSGYKNMQDVSSGYTKSLTNPIDARKMPLFALYNSTLMSNPYTNSNNVYTKGLNFTDCLGKSGSCCFMAFDDYSKGFRVNLFCNGSAKGCNTKTKADSTNCCYYFYSKTINSTNINTARLNKTGNFIKVETTVPGIGTVAESCQLYMGLGGGSTDCSSCLLECLDGVLDAKAVEFKDNSWYYPYCDIDDLVSSNGVGDYINSVNKNKYSNGSVGINRLTRENIYYTNRKQSQKDTISRNKFKTNIGVDGTYENFCIFSWMNGNSGNTQNNWKWTNMPTIYSPYGYELENVNALNVYSSALYGYNNSVPIAIANNARYFEIASEGFEDYSSSSTSITHGHFVTSSNQTIVDTISHSGTHSLLKSSAGSIVMNANDILPSNAYDSTLLRTKNKFIPRQGKEYIISAWIRPATIYAVTRTNYYVSVNFSGTTYTAYISPSVEPINKWYPISLKFKVPSNATTCQINFYMAENNSYLDDIRIQPASSNLKTYVYDCKTLKLSAELDENNYATFYNYDEEGILVQTKKETEKGIFTIKTIRQNIKHR